MTNSFSARLSSALLGALFCSASIAATLPALPENTPVLNDGFIVVAIASHELEMKVCPGTRRWRSKGGFTITSPACFDEFRSGSVKGTGTPAVSPQQALDAAFGERKAKAIGLAPARLENNHEGVVVYYKIVR